MLDKQGLTASSFQQQLAYQRGLEATLASSLTGIAGVRSAQVHLALPEKRLFSQDQDAARASVLLETSGTLRRGDGRRHHPPGVQRVCPASPPRT